MESLKLSSEVVNIKELGRYDTDIQMFVEAPRDPKMSHIRFLRGLAEKGAFGPKPLSVPRGDLLFKLSDQEIFKYAMVQADQTPDQKLRQIQIGGD